MGEIDTLATGTAVTVTSDTPKCKSLLATMAAAPAFTALTSPLEETVATEGSELDHATRRLVIAFPFASIGVAATDMLEPTTSLADVGTIAITATERMGPSGIPVRSLLSDEHAESMATEQTAKAATIA